MVRDNGMAVASAAYCGCANHLHLNPDR